MTLGADASAAAGPVGRQASANTDISLAEIYSYARSRGLFAGIALDGSVISISKSANAALYNKPGVTAGEIFSGQAPAPPETAQRFLERLSQLTHAPLRGAPAPQAGMPVAAPAPALRRLRQHPLRPRRPRRPRRAQLRRRAPIRWKTKTNGGAAAAVCRRPKCCCARACLPACCGYPGGRTRMRRWCCSPISARRTARFPP